MAKKIISKDWSVTPASEISNLPVALKKIPSLAGKVLQNIDHEHIPVFVRELSISFVSDKEMQALNKHYRKKDKTTDVLSFSMIEGLTEKYSSAGALGVHLGDVIISHKQAFRQCKQFGTTPNQEIIRLIIHGILHLLGYDHEKVSEFEATKMRTIENLLFNKYKSVKVLK